jgi:hypothetical protein
MSFAYDRFRQLADLSQDILFKRRRKEPPSHEYSVDLRPKLDTAAKEPEIAQMLTDLNQQILCEIERPDDNRDHHPKPSE